MAMMSSLDSHNNSHVFRLSVVLHVAISSVGSFWQDHRLAQSSGKIFLWVGTDCNNNPPPGKGEVPLFPLF